MNHRIVTVASELFARRGIDGVSIAEVALGAGVSKANVMHHFGSKDGLYSACLDVIDGHLHAVVDDAIAAGASVDDLRDALDRWAREHPDDPRIMAYGLLRLPERDGRWALSEPVTRMIDLVAADRAEARRSADRAPTGPRDVVVDLLGTVTYREMARPLLEADLDAGARPRPAARSTREETR